MIDRVEVNDSNKVPTYDGRLHYHRILSNLMAGTLQMALNEDYYEWIRGIRQVYNWISPYVKESDREKIKMRIDKVSYLYNVYNSGNGRYENMLLYIDKELNGITEDIVIYSKDLLLPVSDEDDVTEFDEAVFKGKR